MIRFRIELLVAAYVSPLASIDPRPPSSPPCSSSVLASSSKPLASIRREAD
jgi:hypothetical protein